MTKPAQAPDIAARRAWLAVLARAGRAELEASVEGLGVLPLLEPVRQPEAGMVMLRGRVGGTGDAFNLGEASVTRSAVRLAGGALGVGYTLGRDRRKAELIAILDALLQDSAQHDAIARQVVTPLQQRQAAARDSASRETAASRVDFFTLVRGEP